MCDQSADSVDKPYSCFSLMKMTFSLSLSLSLFSFVTSFMFIFFLLLFINNLQMSSNLTRWSELVQSFNFFSPSLSAFRYCHYPVTRQSQKTFFLLPLSQIFLFLFRDDDDARYRLLAPCCVVDFGCD